jgi:hypothetical protein
MRKKNVFIIILVILILVGIWFLFFRDLGLDSNKVSLKGDIDISTWKVIEDKQSGVSFMYPSNWVLSGSPSGRNTYVYCSKNIKNCELGSFNFELEYITPGLEKLNLKELTEAYHEIDIKKDGNTSKEENVSNISEVEIDNRAFYQYSIIGSRCFLNNNLECSGGKVLDDETVIIFIENNDEKFEITYPKNNKISQKILETFKFD